jgi:uncharacterized protein (TIGR02646 family)
MARRQQEILETLALPEAKLEQIRVEFDPRLWMQTREFLWELFYGKCAYCESSLLRQRGDLDHFRPKQAAGQLNRRTSVHHYAWLAYEWRNLYLACQECNRNKRNLFPVEGKRAPLGMPIEQMYQIEQGTIVDPCVDLPNEHFAFDVNGDCLPLSARGEISIRVFGLNHPGLVAARTNTFAEMLATLGELAPATRMHAMRLAQRGGSRHSIEHLLEMIGPAQPYSGASAILLFSQIERLVGAAGLPARRFENLYDELPKILLELPQALLREENSQVIERRQRPEIDTEGTRRERDPSETETRHRSARAANKLLDRPAATLRLARVELRNFRAIKHLVLDLDEVSAGVDGAPCLALLGENATGKSSVLEAIALAMLGTSGISKLGIDPHAYLRRPDPDPWETPPELPLLIEICFHGSIEPLRFELTPSDIRFRGPSSAAAVMLAYGPRRYFQESRKRWFSDPWRRVISLFDPTATIPHPGHWLARADARVFAAAVRALREILMLKSNDDLVRDGDGRVLVRSYGRLTPLERLSDGYRSVLSMAVDIMREMLSHWDGLEEARGLVLIDEIETHLHPRWKMRVIGALRRAMPQVQFIVTTHDPLCLRGMTDGEVAVLIRDEEAGIERLSNLPSVRGMRVEQLLHSDYFGLSSTVDPGVEADLADYAALLSQPDETLGEVERSRLIELGDQLTQQIVLGDTAEEQVLHEALQRYQHDRVLGGATARRETRRQAVADVLDILNERSGAGQA